MPYSAEGWKNWRVRNRERRKKYERERRSLGREAPSASVKEDIIKLEKQFPHLDFRDNITEEEA